MRVLVTLPDLALDLLVIVHLPSSDGLNRLAGLDSYYELLASHEKLLDRLERLVEWASATLSVDRAHEGERAAKP